MNCDEAKVLMHALIDGELDAGHARELEIHIAGCPSCAANLREFHELRKMMTPGSLSLKAPADLRARIEGKLPKRRGCRQPARRDQGLCRWRGA